MMRPRSSVRMVLFPWPGARRSTELVERRWRRSRPVGAGDFEAADGGGVVDGCGIFCGEILFFGVAVGEGEFPALPFTHGRAGGLG